jgi:hypothetical protein
MRTNIAFILFLIAASQATILRQRRLARTEGAIYSQVKPLENGQTLKTTLLHLLDDGEGNDGYEITMSMVNKNKAPVTLKAKQLAEILKNDFDVEIDSLFFQGAAESLNKGSSEVTFTWLKEASQKDLAQKGEKKVSYPTGAVNDMIEPTVLTYNEEFHMPALAPKILKAHPPVESLIELAVGKYIKASAKFTYDSDAGSETWEFDFKIIGAKALGRKATADDICNWVRKETKIDVADQQCADLADQLNDPNNAGCGFNHNTLAEVVVRAPEIIYGTHESKSIFANGQTYEFDFKEQLYKDANGNYFDEDLNPVQIAPKLDEPVRIAKDTKGNEYTYDFKEQLYKDAKGNYFDEDLKPVQMAPKLDEPVRMAADANGNEYTYDFKEQLYKDAKGNWFDEDLKPVQMAPKLDEPVRMATDSNGNKYTYDFANQVYVDAKGNWYDDNLKLIPATIQLGEPVMFKKDSKGNTYKWDSKNQVWVDNQDNWFDDDFSPIMKPIPLGEAMMVKMDGKGNSYEYDFTNKVFKDKNGNEYDDNLNLVAKTIHLDEPVVYIKKPVVEAYSKKQVNPVKDQKIQTIKLDEPVQMIKLPTIKPVTYEKIFVQGPVVTVQKAKSPKPLGLAEFDRAAEMRFCIEGLDNAGAFGPNAFDTISLAHRWVRRFEKYEDFPGLPTCYIEFEFERPEICAFSSKIVDGNIAYVLRGDSGASCSKFLTGKGYIAEAKPANTVYTLTHKAGSDDLRDEHSDLIGELIDLLKEGEALVAGASLDVKDFSKISKTFGRHNQYSATFSYNNKDCHITQNKYSDYMAKFELAANSAADCSKVIKALDDQRGVFGHNGGNWQRAAAKALGLAIGELNDNDLIKSGIKFTASELVSVSETLTDNVDIVEINVLKNGANCSFKVKFTADGKSSWVNNSKEAGCKALVQDGKFRL